MEEIKNLRSNLSIPISDVNFGEQNAELILKGNLIGSIKYVKSDGQTVFDYSDKSQIKIDWKLIYELEEEAIKTKVVKLIDSNIFKIDSAEFPIIRIFNGEGKLIISVECSYQDQEWLLFQDLDFEISRRENEIKKLRNQLGQTNFQNPQNSYLEHQNKMIDKIVDKGVEIYAIWKDNESKNEHQEMELVNEFEKQELNVVNRIDKRDKIFKGGIVITCLLLMGVLAYFEKASPVLPLIGVIIGLVLQNDSISKYFSGSAKKRNAASMFDEE